MTRIKVQLRGNKGHEAGEVRWDGPWTLATAEVLTKALRGTSPDDVEVTCWNRGRDGGGSECYYLVIDREQERERERSISSW